MSGRAPIHSGRRHPPDSSRSPTTLIPWFGSHDRIATARMRHIPDDSFRSTADTGRRVASPQSRQSMSHGDDRFYGSGAVTGARRSA